MTIARRGRAALGGSDGCLGTTFGRTGCFACILGLAPCGRSHIAFVLAGLLDARPFGIARGSEPDRLGVDARLFGSLFDDDVVDLLADLRQSVTLAQTYRGRRGGAGAHRVSIPAPHSAIARDKLLAGLQRRLQHLAGGVIGNETDEGDPAREFRQRRDVGAERRRPFGQRRCIGERLHRQPVHRRATVRRGFEFVAKRRTQRLLEAGLDRESVEQRRPERIGRRLQRRSNTRFLRPQFGQPRVGFLHDLGSGDVARLGGLAFSRAGTLHVDALGFGLGHCHPRRF